MTLFPDVTKHITPGHGPEDQARHAGGTSRGGDSTDRAKRTPNRQTPSKFVNPRTGEKMSPSERGDTYEELLLRKVADIFQGKAQLAPVATAENRNTPLDMLLKVGGQTFGAEVKSLNANAKNQKAAIKKVELERKRAAVAAAGVKGAMVVQVVNQATQSVDVYAHLGEFVSRNVTSMQHVGTYSYTAKDFNEAQSARGWLRKHLGPQHDQQAHGRRGGWTVPADAPESVQQMASQLEARFPGVNVRVEMVDRFDRPQPHQVGHASWDGDSGVIRVRRDSFMPERTVAHEFGHVLQGAFWGDVSAEGLAVRQEMEAEVEAAVRSQFPGRYRMDGVMMPGHPRRPPKRLAEGLGGHAAKRWGELVPEALARHWMGESHPLGDVLGPVVEAHAQRLGLTDMTKHAIDPEFAQGDVDIDGETIEPGDAVVEVVGGHPHLYVAGGDVAKHADHNQKDHGRRGGIGAREQHWRDQGWGDRAAEIAKAEAETEGHWSVHNATLPSVEKEARAWANSVYTFEHEESGLRAEVRDVLMGSNLDVRGPIVRISDGEPVGEFRRQVATGADGRPWVNNSHLSLFEEYRGKGFATAFNRDSENHYIAAGITEVSVLATNVGRYAWAKTGFDFDLNMDDGDIHGIASVLMDYAEFGGPTRDLERIGEGLLKFGGREDAYSAIRQDGLKPIHIAWAEGGKDFLLGRRAGPWHGIKRLVPPEQGRVAAAVPRLAALDLATVAEVHYRWALPRGVDEGFATDADEAPFWRAIELIDGSLLKHADHNQKDHGRRGGGTDLAARLEASLLKAGRRRKTPVEVSRSFDVTPGASWDRGWMLPNGKVLRSGTGEHREDARAVGVEEIDLVEEGIARLVWRENELNVNIARPLTEKQLARIRRGAQGRSSLVFDVVERGDGSRPSGHIVGGGAKHTRRGLGQSLQPRQVDDLLRDIARQVTVAKHADHNQLDHGRRGRTDPATQEFWEEQGWGERSAELAEAAQVPGQFVGKDAFLGVFRPRPGREPKLIDMVPTDVTMDLVRETFEIEHAGLRSEIVKAEGVGFMLGEKRDELEVVGVVRNERGENVGSFVRNIAIQDSGKKVAVLNSHFHLDPEVRGKGFATALNRNAENHYITHGVDRIGVSATEAGRYAWARNGFGWDASDQNHAQRLKQAELRDYLADREVPVDLAAEVNEGLMRGMTPVEMASLGVNHEWRVKGRHLGKDFFLTARPWKGVKTLRPPGERLAAALSVTDLAVIAEVHYRWATVGGVDEGFDTDVDEAPFWRAVSLMDGELAKHLRGRHDQQSHAGTGHLFDPDAYMSEAEALLRKWYSDEEADRLLDAALVPGDFGLGMTMELAKATWEIEHAGLRSVVESVNPPGGRGTTVEGFIEHIKSGETVGRWSRRGVGSVVKHQELNIDDEHQGKGFATEFNRNAETYYMAKGVQEIQVETADVGGYAWARAGFDWRSGFGDYPVIQDELIEIANDPSPHVEDELLELAEQVRDIGDMQEAGVHPWDIAAAPGGKDLLIGKGWMGAKYIGGNVPRELARLAASKFGPTPTSAALSFAIAAEHYKWASANGVDEGFDTDVDDAPLRARIRELTRAVRKHAQHNQADHGNRTTVQVFNPGAKRPRRCKGGCGGTEHVVERVGSHSMLTSCATPFCDRKTSFSLMDPETGEPTGLRIKKHADHNQKDHGRRGAFGDEPFTPTDKGQEWIEQALETFPVTDDPDRAGWILPDGRMLDFGRNEDDFWDPITNEGGFRIHADITVAAAAGDFLDFMDETGAVRMHRSPDATLNVHVTRPFSRAQRALISRIPASGIYIDVGYFWGDLETYGGDSFGSVHLANWPGEMEVARTLRAVNKELIEKTRVAAAAPNPEAVRARWAEFEKHLQGQHNQADHAGKRSAHSRSGLMAQIADADDGGFTYRPIEGVSPTTGFIVAISGHEEVHSLEEFLADPERATAMVADYMMRKWDVMKSRPELHIGAWRDDDTGRVVFDLSEVYTDLNTASRIGKERDQDALWDIENNTAISLRKARDLRASSRGVDGEGPRRVDRAGHGEDSPVGRADGEGALQALARELRRAVERRDKRAAVALVAEIAKHAQHNQLDHGRRGGVATDPLNLPTKKGQEFLDKAFDLYDEFDVQNPNGKGFLTMDGRGIEVPWRGTDQTHHAVARRVGAGEGLEATRDFGWETGAVEVWVLPNSLAVRSYTPLSKRQADLIASWSGGRQVSFSRWSRLTGDQSPVYDGPPGDFEGMERALRVMQSRRETWNPVAKHADHNQKDHGRRAGTRWHDEGDPRMRRVLDKVLDLPIRGEREDGREMVGVTDLGVRSEVAQHKEEAERLLHEAQARGVQPQSTTVTAQQLREEVRWSEERLTRDSLPLAIKGINTGSTETYRVGVIRDSDGTPRLADGHHRAGAFVLASEELGWDPLPIDIYETTEVVKHAQHNQLDHGRRGGTSGWKPMMSEEDARAWADVPGNVVVDTNGPVTLTSVRTKGTAERAKREGFGEPQEQPRRKRNNAAGIYFAPDAESLSGFASGKGLPEELEFVDAYVRLENPRVVTDNGPRSFHIIAGQTRKEFWGTESLPLRDRDAVIDASFRLTSILQEQGYDGVVVRSSFDGHGFRENLAEVVVFDPKNIVIVDRSVDAPEVEFDLPFVAKHADHNQKDHGRRGVSGPSAPNVVQYLEMLDKMQREHGGREDWKHKSREGLVLAEGQPMKGQPLPEDIERGEMKECFANSGRCALDAVAESSGLTYVEGFAQPKTIPIPVPHAWLTDGKGNAYDPTWSDATEVEYYGVPIATDYLRKWILHTEMWGVIHSEIPGPDNLFKDGLPDEARPSFTKSLAPSAALVAAIVRKHADHNQKDHGRRGGATGVPRSLAELGEWLRDRESPVEGFDQGAYFDELREGGVIGQPGEPPSGEVATAVKAIQEWSQDTMSTGIRAAVRELRTGERHQVKNRDTNLELAESLYRAVADAPAEPGPLWLGDPQPSTAHAAELMAQMQPGATVSMSMKSFSRDERSATGFALPIGNEAGVVFKVEAGARGLHIGPLAPWKEDEVISGGRFEVLSVEQGQVPVVVLRQISPTELPESVRMSKHLQGQHEQETHGRRGFGPKPEPTNLPDIKQDEEGFLSRMDEYRTEVRAWESRIGQALSVGDLTQDEAVELGYYVDGHERAGGGWTKLPERLWHVTTAADAVRRDGLKSRAELGQERGKGLGGGTSDTISFTADRAIAENIRESMLEMHAVARGDFTPEMMLERARVGDRGSKPFLEDMVQGQYGRWSEGDPYPEGLQSILDGVRYEDGMSTGEAPINRNYYDDEPHGPDAPRVPQSAWRPVPGTERPGAPGRYHRWVRDRTPAEQMTARIQLFKNFSAYRDFAGGLADPLFVSIDGQGLAAIDPAQIQVMEFRGTGFGFQLGALGEWRTKSGDAVELVR